MLLKVNRKIDRILINHNYFLILLYVLFSSSFETQYFIENMKPFGMEGMESEIDVFFFVSNKE